jgi:hypothetical protein
MNLNSSTPSPEPSTTPRALHLIDSLLGIGRLRASKTAVPLDITVEQVERFKKDFGI